MFLWWCFKLSWAKEATNLHNVAPKVRSGATWVCLQKEECLIWPAAYVLLVDAASDACKYVVLSQVSQLADSQSAYVPLTTS